VLSLIGLVRKADGGWERLPTQGAKPRRCWVSETERNELPRNLPLSCCRLRLSFAGSAPTSLTPLGDYDMSKTNALNKAVVTATLDGENAHNLLRSELETLYLAAQRLSRAAITRVSWRVTRSS
jgi:hypothetical protein